MVSIRSIAPELIAYLPKSFTQFIHEAAVKSPTSDLTADDALNNARQGLGEIITVSDENTPLGCAYFMTGNTPKGKILDIVLLGGVEFNKWKAGMRSYALETAKNQGCYAIWIMSSKGWGRVFPDMEEIGRIYELTIY